MYKRQYTNFGVCDFSRLAVTDWCLRRWLLWFLALSNAPPPNKEERKKMEQKLAQNTKPSGKSLVDREKKKKFSASFTQFRKIYGRALNGIPPQVYGARLASQASSPTKTENKQTKTKMSPFSGWSSCTHSRAKGAPGRGRP